MRRSTASGLLALALILITVAAYWPAGRNGFVNLDDDAYVEFAPMVNRGFHPAAVAWALTSVHTANWHPLTTLSHMLDCELFGIKPAPMHWENVGWHVLNTLLVFLVWRRLSGAVWRSALVAALFALHPLHVESVAWISSRKDLLCTFFWLLGLAAYVRWTAKPSALRYSAVALCLALALLAKPMAVTFPATLLLLDAWPLRRRPAVAWSRLGFEKLPLFAIVFAHSAITWAVQSGAGAAAYSARIPLDARLGNAVVSYVRYLGKTFWPDPLTPMYWHPGYWPAWAWLGAAVVLAGLTLGVWRLHRRLPWLGFGWLWFLGTLVPVIGLVQVGAQAMADRYTYVPLLGVFTVVAWGGAALVATNRRRLLVAAAATAAIIAACGIVTRRQISTWENSLRLYENCLAAGEDNPAVRYLYGVALQAAGRPEAEFAAQFRRALDRAPDYVNAHTQLALIALRHQRFDEARQMLEQNIRFEPSNASLHSNLGSFWSLRNDFDRALPCFERALQLTPQAPGLHRELASIYAKLNRVPEARRHYELAIKYDGWAFGDYNSLGFLVGNLGELAESRRLFERALWLEPGNEFSRRNLAALTQLERARGP